MKKVLILVAVFLIVIFSLNAQTKKVLFIGNSYTMSNGNLGSWVKEIATSVGDSFEYEQVAFGGYKFSQHATNTQTISAIAQGDWDYVVLQEQSQYPSFPPSQVANEVYPYAKILCDSIYSANECTIPMFFMTWGYQNGDPNNCQYYEPLCTYEGMQQRLSESYIEMAEQNNAQVAPVGEVWKIVRQNLDDVSVLYADAGAHPTPLGTYLAACTFYASMYHKSVQDVVVPSSIDPSKAQIVKNAVDQVVLENFDDWFIDTVKIRAEFDYIIFLDDTKNVTATFVNLTQDADSCFWIFGDGNVFMQYPNGSAWNMWDMVEHDYENTGDYNVCLTAYSKCQSPHTKCQEFYITYSSVDNNFVNDIAVMPNPANDYITISGINELEIDLIQIIDLSGRLIYSANPPNSATIDISKLNQGTYFLKIETIGKTAIRRFVKD
ncbi:MAG: DUF4886 domain-containing protein [Bacteroidales bacterium]|nr:DUF4886 domain-containing protein [Bacteroidales bacterium]